MAAATSASGVCSDRGGDFSTTPFSIGIEQGFEVIVAIGLGFILLQIRRNFLGAVDSTQNDGNHVGRDFQLPVTELAKHILAVACASLSRHGNPRRPHVPLMV